MATITAQNILDRAELLLHDDTNIRWPLVEGLNWINEGQREIVLLKPDAYSLTEALKMIAGTKQTIPAAGTMLLDVTRNMGDDGTTVGNVIRLVARRILDDGQADWHTQDAAAVVKHWVYDPETNPRVFYIWPKSDATNYIEICYAKAPTEIAAVGDTITLDDIYSPALLNYFLYRAYAKDADYASNAQRAQQARNDFLQVLGRMDLMEGAKNPELLQLQRVQRTMEQAAG